MLLLNHRLSNRGLALAAGGVSLGLLGYLRFCSSTVDIHSPTDEFVCPPPAIQDIIRRTGPIPPEYGIPCGSADKISRPDACLDTASAEYLRGLRSNATEYCSSRSGDSITCFNDTLDGHYHEYDHDLFCIAQGVVLEELVNLFSSKCDNRHAEPEPPRGVFDLDVMRTQWGLGPIFDEYFYIRFKSSGIVEAPLEVEAKQYNYTILIKRERAANFWDSLMGIMSMMISMDVLRMSSDIRSGEVFINVPADLPKIQVIILDDLPDGPLYDLWSYFAGSAPVRFRAILEDKTRADALLSAHTAIIPLPGQLNPLSQTDQHGVSDRRYSALARTFARRVLQKYGVLSPRGGSSIASGVRVTLIAWPGTREVRDVDHLLQALRGAFPNVLAEAVDLAAMPMADQLKLVQSTDVLVGVHGAGLSHILFMREGEVAVVEIQPAELSTTQHQSRYKNLAAMLGQKYFLVEAEVVPLGRVGSGEADVEQSLGGDAVDEIEIELARRDTELNISVDKFVAQVGRAIEALVV